MCVGRWSVKNLIGDKMNHQKIIQNIFQKAIEFAAKYNPSKTGKISEAEIKKHFFQLLKTSSLDEAKDGVWDHYLCHIIIP